MDDIYVMEPISEGIPLYDNHIDAMIVAAGCDSRVYEGISKLLRLGVTVDELIILKFQSQLIEPENPLYQAYTMYNALPVAIAEIELDDNDLFLDPKKFVGKKILLDITGFSIPNLFRMMYVLREVLTVPALYVVYTEPAHYIFSNDTFGSYTYYIGEREYRAVDEFFVSGDDNRELLTLFLGFDRMTSSIVKEAVDPTETILINGFPAMTPKLKDVSLLNNHELIAILGKPQYSVKANNPFSTFNVLSQIQQTHPGMLLNVCVLGTKPMALGASLYALKNKNVKLSYAHTKSHASQTTIGSSNTWSYFVRF